MVDQVADLHLPKSKFRFILINSYSESSGRWGGRSTPHCSENGNLGFMMIDCHFESSGRLGGWSNPRWHGDLRFILIDSYSESSGRPGGISTPLDMVIWDSYWKIPTLRVQADQVANLPPWTWWFEIHTDRFLLWELRQTRWQIKWQM